MSATTFVSKVTRIARAWLQDVNDVVYEDLNGPGGLAASSGSSLVGFIQFGSATTETLETAVRRVGVGVDEAMIATLNNCTANR